MIGRAMSKESFPRGDINKDTINGLLSQPILGEALMALEPFVLTQLVYVILTNETVKTMFALKLAEEKILAELDQALGSGWQAMITAEQAQEV